MLHTPTRGGRRPSVAIMCFIPDYGHLQPLLKIADAMHERGFHIKCYIAEECRPLLQRFKFEFYALNSTAAKKNEKEMTKAFGRSTFFNSICLYLHYLMMYPRVVVEVGNSASRLSQELHEQQPDLIICDALWFTDFYQRIARSLGVELIQNSFDGSLAYNQRPFVQNYGVTRTPRPIQSVVEIMSSISRIVCTSYYRFRYLAVWRRLRAMRRFAAAQFNGAFPLNGHADKPSQWLVVGTAKIERQRLGGVIQLGGADRPEFAALQFRSFQPVPAELLNWINSGDRPIVYVSFGSAVDIDARFARAIYEALRTVDARVLWSLPAAQRSLLSGLQKVDKIRIESFVPQPEILALPNVKCFVTQGGPHSVQEALFGATPMLCIPFFVDQAYNSSVVERLGVGKRLWRRDVSAKSVSSAIGEVLGTASYSSVAAEISQDFISNEGGAAIAAYVGDLLMASHGNRIIRQRQRIDEKPGPVLRA